MGWVDRVKILLHSLRRCADERAQATGPTSAITARHWQQLAARDVQVTVRLGGGSVLEPPILAELLEAFSHPDEEQREVVAAALGELGHPRAVFPLRQALGDVSAAVRAAAAEALGKIGSSEGVPGLMSALEDREPEVRAAAARSLGWIKEPEGVPRLLEVLRDADEDIQRAAAEALADIGEPAFEGLAAALNDRRAVQAAEALGLLGTPDAVPLLLAALKQSEADVRRAAAQALGRIGDPEALSALGLALRDAQEVVQRAAAYALAELGPEGHSTLRAALEDPDPRVRAAAGCVLS